METAEAAHPVSPDRLKQEGDRTPPAGRSSPPPNCAICLGACQNKSFTDSCLHQFCFNCLLTWSKIKAECPLCKQTFKSIIHNVRSNHQYEEYLVEQQQQASDMPVNVPEPESQRRFRYRTTITIPRRDAARSAIQRLLVSQNVESAPPPRPDAFQHRRSFRQTVYRHNLWARPLPDFTGRLRECTPEFYRANEAQRYRLVPWLTRELDTLLSANHSHIAYVMARILDLLPVHPILSEQFRYELLPFFGDQTEHFVHELHCFACTPFDMLGYDRNVQYGPDPRLGASLNHVISSSDSDSGSDVVMVSVPPPPLQPPQNDPYVIPIETISHSDTDDSSNEVVVTGFLKPPQDRTPEVVDLLASDSDVVLNEDTPQPSTSRQQPSASVKVKLTMSKRVHPPSSDSEEEYMPHSRRYRQKQEDEDYVPYMEARQHKRRHRSQSASTVSTRMDTPSPSESSWNPVSSTTGSRESWANSEQNDPSYTPPPPDLPENSLSERSLIHIREARKRKLQRRIRTEQRRRERAENPSREDRDRKKKDKKSKKSQKKDHDRPSTSGTRKDCTKRKSDKNDLYNHAIPSTCESQDESTNIQKECASGSREERANSNQNDRIKKSSRSDRAGTSGSQGEHEMSGRKCSSKERSSSQHVDRYKKISDIDHPSNSKKDSRKERSKKLRSVVCSLPRHLLTIGEDVEPSTSGTRRPEKSGINPARLVDSSARLYEAPTPERPIQWLQTPERHAGELLTPERFSQESLTPERLLERSPRSEADPNIYQRGSSTDSPEIKRRRAGRAQVISSDSEDDFPLNLCVGK